MSVKTKNSRVIVNKRSCFSLNYFRTRGLREQNDFSNVSFLVANDSEVKIFCDDIVKTVRF